VSSPGDLHRLGYSLIRRPAWPAEQSLALYMDPTGNPSGEGIIYSDGEVDTARFPVDLEEDGWEPYNG